MMVRTGIALTAALAASLLAAAPTGVHGFSASSRSSASATATTTDVAAATPDRRDFLSAATTATATTASAVLLTAAVSFTAAAPLPASARGRATLEQSYDRYVPRIVSGGSYYKSDLRTHIERNDFGAIKAATSDPPPKTREDRSKLDGGVSDRAAKAGGFSDARVLVAADLFAAAFSDNSVSPKTKAMKAEVETLREVVRGMNEAA
eukprot:CAMPEP_0183293778 /NCGR_PEP_ID=MMETSP0160_2-20130417/2344_1 /TAXON_ID=2839 ORGANISM="Odontella Sinensis, Strain Grunow 1884" /NCGR_SAMPLE_ID=MMETSP0160_2 /ASSEMBLY_ACC=CAM_ASM_000250 /LENGTH=206 /DNA_ID=CAMNT_0025454957 /DNA_START=112 /DNA_END=729 /DNA_ORIENTATION=-